MKAAGLALLAGIVIALAGCGEAPPAEKPPEAKATPRLVEEQPAAAEAGSSAGPDLPATRHGYSADGKPVPHDPQGGDAVKRAPAATSSPSPEGPAEAGSAAAGCNCGEKKPGCKCGHCSGVIGECHCRH